MRFSAKLAVLCTTSLMMVSMAWAVVPFIPNQGIAGSWFNPDTDGQGFLFEHLPTQSNTLVVYWFTFDPENPGDQIWATGTGKLIGTSADISFLRVNDGVFNDPNPIAVVSDWALMTIDFIDCRNATVDFTIPSLAITGQYNIRRITKDYNCASGGVSPPGKHFGGTYLGEWHNTTFDSRGNATAIITYDMVNENFDMSLDLDGFVFGQGDPDPLIFTDIAINGLTEIAIDDPTFGKCTFLFKPSGAFNGTCAPVAFDRVDIEGSLSPAHLAMSYKIFSGADLFAEGVVTINRSE